MPSFPPLEGDIKTDVLVIGGGIAGLLTAYAMKEAGIGCVLAEAKRLCTGVTKNTTAKITSQHGLIYARLLTTLGRERANAYYLANEGAVRRYESLCRQIPCGFQKQDAYVYSVNRPVTLAEEMDALEKLGIPGEYVSHPALPMKTVGAIRFREQGRFHPLQFLAAIAGELEIYEQTEVLRLEGSVAVTNRGRIQAEHIVVATHFPVFNKYGLYFLKQYQDRSYVLALEGAKAPEGMYLDEAEGGLSFRTAERQLLLGGGSHRTGKPGSGWAPLEAFAREHYPEARHTARWATQDCITLDGIPYIGRYGRRTRNLYAVTGFGKWGMTSAMAGAELLRDMVLGEKNPAESLFDPHRPMPRPQLAANAMEAARNLLTLSRPRCPHLGCTLKWNPRERSWDCPCHGSRFAADGTLLDNPATGNLKKQP